MCTGMSLTVLALSSCGGSDAPSHSNAANRVAQHPYWKYDGDTDPDDHTVDRPSSDDVGLQIAAAHGATAAEKSAIAAIGRRYFADALAGNGADGCRLLQPSLAAGLSGQSEHVGCARALTENFQREHTHFVAENPGTMTVTGVHVEGDAASVTLGFEHAPETGMALERRHGTGSEIGTWKLAALSDSELP